MENDIKIIPFADHLKEIVKKSKSTLLDDFVCQTILHFKQEAVQTARQGNNCLFFRQDVPFALYRNAKLKHRIYDQLKNDGFRILNINLISLKTEYQLLIDCFW